jgi:flagellar hook-associated protein 2
MYGTSITRLSGLASGMDTDSLVKKLMQAESVRLNKMMQDKQKDEWISDGYRQWNSDVFSFGNTLFNMTLSSNYGTFDVSSSNNDSVSGTATASAVAGTYTIQVDKLAEAATLQSASQINIATDKSFTDQNITTTGTFSIQTTDSTGTHNATITIDSTDKIGDLINNLNQATDLTTGQSLGLQATYDSSLQKFILKTKESGLSTNITITDTTGGFFKTTLGFGSTLNDSGQNASLIYTDNQTNTTVSSPSNNVSIMGVNYTLKNISSIDSSTGKPIPSTITVTRNLDTEVKNIEDFINKYNDMLDKLNKALDEPVYRDYQPLTDDQRSAMTDTQIEKWEEKAKSGLFHNDSILRGLVNKMRNHITAIVPTNSKYNSLASIGIESKSWDDKGKLYVDETKLRAALQDDPDAVKNLFTQNPNNATSNQKGVIQQLYTDFTDTNTGAVKLLTDKAGKTGNSMYDQSVVGKLLSNLNTQIYEEQQRLNDKENQYYKQFTAMETAMSQYNSQSAWLGQQFATNG